MDAIVEEIRGRFDCRTFVALPIGSVVRLVRSVVGHPLFRLFADEEA